MRTIKVHLLAFVDHEIRNVHIPEPQEDIYSLLRQVFHFGQNDFQPQQRPSVSAGDVAEVDGEFWLAKSFGWGKMEKHEFDAYVATPREERYQIYFML